MLAPAIHTHTDMAIYPVLGTMISHGYISSGFLPIRLSFCTVVSCLKVLVLNYRTPFFLSHSWTMLVPLKELDYRMPLRVPTFLVMSSQILSAYSACLGAGKCLLQQILGNFLSRSLNMSFFWPQLEHFMYSVLESLQFIMHFGSNFQLLTYTSYIRSLMQLLPRSFKILKNLWV